jgi:hypothetical protein
MRVVVHDRPHRASPFSRERGIENPVPATAQSPAGLHSAEQQVGTGDTDHKRDAIFDRPQECLMVGGRRRCHEGQGTQDQPTIAGNLKYDMVNLGTRGHAGKRYVRSAKV